MIDPVKRSPLVIPLSSCSQHSTSIQPGTRRVERCGATRPACQMRLRKQLAARLDRQVSELDLRPALADLVPPHRTRDEEDVGRSGFCFSNTLNSTQRNELRTSRNVMQVSGNFRKRSYDHSQKWGTSSGGYPRATISAYVESN